MAKTLALVYLLAAILTYGLIPSLALPQDNTSKAAQILLSEVPRNEKPDNSNLILASLYSLRKSWSQAYAPHGHAVLPVTIKTGTLLYHMGGTRAPRHMQWFGFDAEHSYNFGGGWRSPPMGHRVLYTYTATRPLRALYFDGFSAAKTPEGTLDSQDILLYGEVEDWRHPHDDYDRGALLCEWGKEFGIEGFVREEVTFELLWCDFQTGVQLLDTANATIPSSSSSSSPDPSPSADTHVCNPHHAPDKQNWLGHPNSQQCPHFLFPREILTPYSTQNVWSFYRAASWHAYVPEQRITLHPAYFVTLYDPSYTSLAVNHKLPVLKHRLTGMSAEDVSAFRGEVRDACEKWREDGFGAMGSGVDWSAIVQGVVDRNGDRLSELRHTLSRNATSSSGSINITQVVGEVRLVAFALVMPYIDHVSILSPNSSSEARLSSLGKATEHCTKAFTGHFNALAVGGVKLTKQEQRLRDAVEGVLRRVCRFGTNTLGEALDLLDKLEDRGDSGGEGGPDEVEGRKMLERWREEVEGLMDWLGWAGVWQRCPRACDWDEQCYIPMWPIIPPPEHDDHPWPPPPDAPPPEAKEFEPRCVGKEWFAKMPP
ncbi:hypothetical protein PILCRDRAFT_505623 [Piloderma croceum F 1598]|uniref:Uncharacterized protein n=1 Tax=Piloderma croceum (strain F 1598) TaxID=765440 RepID=A0A0C3BV77_PILCF|nr:hypothetical protein PILCRDRAFT_505623 [Piloderma croceum F 1598]